MKPVWTTDEIIGQLANWEGRWSQDEPVAYSFYEAPAPHLGRPPGYSSFSAVQREATARAFDLIADVANISFVEVPDNGTLPGADNQRISFFNIDYANAAFWGVLATYQRENEAPPFGEVCGAEIIVNQHRAAVQGGWDIAESNPRKLMHEMLHAVGLDHPGPYNGEGSTYESDAIFLQDSLQYTVMSYWDAAETDADHAAGDRTYIAATPLLYDVAALQYLYGANQTTRTGDTVYGFNATAGRDAFDFRINARPVVTIWDAAGIDTLDLSGFAEDARIDLREGAFSDAAGLTANISIAFGASIENVVGGAGNDRITGNDLANRLRGGAGDDLFDGLGGADHHDLGDGGADRILVSRGEAGGEETIAGFGADDRLTLAGARLRGGDYRLVDGERLELDVDLDGLFDTSYRLLAPETGNGFLAVGEASGGTDLMLAPWMIALAEAQAIAPAAPSGIIAASYLSGLTADRFAVTILPGDSGAAFDNSLGVYEVNAAGAILDVRIIAANAKSAIGTIMVEGVEADHRLGFFLVQDGANQLTAAQLASTSLGLIDSGGRLVLANGGAAMAGVVTFVSHDAARNPDGVQHVVSGLDPERSGTIRIGFEDLLQDDPRAAFDSDFQDVVIQVEALPEVQLLIA